MPTGRCVGTSSASSTAWSPQGEKGYEHDYEGPDDLPAHFKASLLGCQLSLPVRDGTLALGVWQGIYLGEHREHGGARRVLATLHGQAI